MIQKFEVTRKQLSQMTGIGLPTLGYYLDGVFIHIFNTRKRKKIKYPNGKVKSLDFFTVTNKDIADIRAYKLHRLRQDGIQHRVY